MSIQPWDDMAARVEALPAAVADAIERLRGWADVDDDSDDDWRIAGALAAWATAHDAYRDAGPLYSPASDDADLAPRQRQAGARGAV